MHKNDHIIYYFYALDYQIGNQKGMYIILKVKDLHNFRTFNITDLLISFLPTEAIRVILGQGYLNLENDCIRLASQVNAMISA